MQCWGRLIEFRSEYVIFVEAEILFGPCLFLVSFALDFVDRIFHICLQLMQYSMVNYLFPLLVITIIFSVAINFFVVLVKLLFTSDITPAMRTYQEMQTQNPQISDQFPKWKFFVMGSLDGLSLLFLLVGGAYVSGIKQLILLQGTKRIGPVVDTRSCSADIDGLLSSPAEISWEPRL